MSSLSTKLTALLGLPLVVLVALAGLGVLRASDEAATSRATAKGVQLSLAAANVARQLSREGDLSAEVVALTAQVEEPPPPAPAEGEDDGEDGDDSDDEAAPPAQSEQPAVAQAAAPPSTTPQVPAELNEQRRSTDETLDRLRSEVEGGGEATEVHMDDALDGLARLDQARAQVDQGARDTSEVVGAYADITDPILDVDRLLKGTRSPVIINQLTAHLALTRAMQTIAREENLIAAMLASGTVDPAVYEKVVGLDISQRHWLNQFEDTAATEDLESFSEAEAVPASATAQRLRQTALQSGPGGPAVGSASIWSNAVGRRLDLLEGIADDTAAKLTDAAASQKAAAEGHRRIAVLLFLGTLALAFGAMYLLHRMAVRPLKRLAEATREASEAPFPTAEELAESNGEPVGPSALTPLPIASDSELRDMAVAFNTLQERAIELAAGGAALRGDVNTVFLNFGRRTQSLVTRQLSHIDSLEARTDNPDTLADLFLLDHLATRLRRNAESLVVLAGADSPRPWARPVSVVNVVRAAVAEAADYSRVDLATMPQASVIGSSANDVSHLLAELIDNALAFSPPETRVAIAGEQTPDGQYRVTVSDSGVGMSPRQLTEANERIARTPVSEVTTARYFGLYVVGQLAQRHGLTVRLVPSRTDGVCAEVVLPTSVLATTVPTSEPAAIAMGSPWASWRDG